MPVTVDDVIAALRPVEDPELHRSIVDLGMVRDVTIDGDTVALEVTLTVAGCPLRNEIQSRVTGALTAIGVRAVDLRFGIMTDEQRAGVREMLHGDPSATAGSQASHGHAEGRAIPFADPECKTRVLLIASGKGGVGKSSVTTNLSVTLAQRGHSVAVIDADVWGFSIPRMLGVEHPPAVIDSMLVPPTGAGGVRCISMGFFAKEDQPVIWRGPMLHKALEQFLTDVFWDDPDFLLVDLPPGTGDISLSLAQFLPRAEVYVVTTPQPAAQRVAQRAGFMAQKVNLEVKGVIENMSWFVGDDGKRYELFGAGGGDALADALGAPLLGQVPLVTELRAGGDSGSPDRAEPARRRRRGGVRTDRRAHRGGARPHPSLPQGAQAPLAPGASGGSCRRGRGVERLGQRGRVAALEQQGDVEARPSRAARSHQQRPCRRRSRCAGCVRCSSGITSNPFILGMRRSSTIASTREPVARLEHLDVRSAASPTTSIAVVAQAEPQQQPHVRLVVGDEHPQLVAVLLAWWSLGRRKVDAHVEPASGMRLDGELAAVLAGECPGHGKPEPEAGRRGDGGLAPVEELEGEVHVVGLQLGALRSTR